MTMTPPNDLAERRICAALGHPLRLHILRAIGSGVSSPVQLARQLGEPLANISYHVRVLVDRDCLELVSTRPVRGALEHRYRVAAGIEHAVAGTTKAIEHVDQELLANDIAAVASS